MNTNVLMRYLAAITLAVGTTTATPTWAAPTQDGIPVAQVGPRPPGPWAQAAEPGTPAGRPKGAKRQTYPFRGKIATVDAATMTVTLEGRTTRRRILVNPDTRLMRDGNPTTLETLKPGETVGGTLRKTPEGQEIATLVRVGARPDAAAGSIPGDRSPEVEP